MQRALVTAAALLAFTAAQAAADDGPLGPAVGNNRYRSGISPAGDVDEFVGNFVPGERLSVTVVAQRPSSRVPPTLRPAIDLVNPDGQVLTVPTTPTAGGAGTAFKDFALDAVGAWVVRVRGDADTLGDYLVTFRVKPAPKTVLENQILGPIEGTSRVHTFDAPAGARVDAVLTWRTGGAPVDIRGLVSPSETELFADGVPATGKKRIRKNRVELRGVVLPAETGTYGLSVATTGSLATYELALTVTSAKRLSGKKVMTVPSAEPELDSISEPIVASAGATVRITGKNFSTAAKPQVVFCTERSPSVAVDAEGDAIDAVVPPRSGPCVVSVTVVNPDGQGARKPLYFAYMGPPTVTDFVDDATGAPIRDVTSAGGRTVRVLGANFEDGQIVRVGTAAVAAPLCVDGSTFKFVVPALDPGVLRVLVADTYGRSGTSAFVVRSKAPPTFSANAFAPAFISVQTVTSVTLRGYGFAAGDQVFVDGTPVSTTFVDAQTLRFLSPALAAGNYPVSVADTLGGVAGGVWLVVKTPPAITAVSVVAGEVIGSTTIPVVGGSRIRVDGSGFMTGDVVTLGGTTVPSFLVQTSTRKEFLAPAGAPGAADLTVTDSADQTASVTSAVTYAALADASADRVPASSSTDDFAAGRGAAADLDGDDVADDLVLVAPLGTSIGNRAERTRVLLGEEGALVDATDDAMPAAGSDDTGLDTWDATCVALGDVDGSGSMDIVLGGVVSPGEEVGQVRLLTNSGTGTFSLSPSQPGTRGTGELTADYTWMGYSYYYGYYWYTATYTVADAEPQTGEPTAVGLGDVDADGDLDVLVGTDEGGTQRIFYDFNYIDFSETPAVASALVPVDMTRFLPGTRLYENRLGDDEGFVDVSETQIPACGTSGDTMNPLPGLHCRDLALADLDNDGDDDLVLVWDDPTTVSGLGLATKSAYGWSSDTTRAATRVLRNDSGTFVDVTSTWMPSGAAPEFWQADRLRLADLDGDGDPDLLLATKGSLDAYTGIPTRGSRALRLLRNDGTRFTNVTATALPAVVSSIQDDLRADAITVHDVNGDGVRDVLIATTDPLRTSGNANAPRLRVLFGRSGLGFAYGGAFSAAPGVDTGEAVDVVIVPELADDPTILLLGRTAPAVAPTGSPRLRAQEWQR